MIKKICHICGKEMIAEIYYSKSTKDYKFCISSYGIYVCDECRDELNKLMKKQKAESEDKE